MYKKSALLKNDSLYDWVRNSEEIRKFVDELITLYQAWIHISHGYETHGYQFYTIIEPV